MIQAPGWIHICCLNNHLQNGLGLIWFPDLFTVLIPCVVLGRVAASALDEKLRLQQVLYLRSRWAASWRRGLPLCFLCCSSMNKSHPHAPPER